MQPETSLLQRLAGNWPADRALLLINPPDTPAEHAGLCIAGVLHDQYDQHLRWAQAASEQLPVWFATHLSAQQMPGCDRVILFLPKGKARLQAQLHWLASACRPGTQIVLIGAIKSGIKSAGRLLSPHCDPVQKLDAARHCQAIAGTLRPDSVVSAAAGISAMMQSWSLAATDLAAGDAVHGLPESMNITTLPGVFASGRLDAGSELLLQTLVMAQASLPRSGALLDYACGSGVLAAVVHQLLPQLSVTAVDVDAWALAACRCTLAGVPDIDIRPSARADDVTGRYELIISNPPFHRQFQQTTSITAGFLQQLPQLLSRQGQCWLVANRFLPYEHMLADSRLNHVEVAANAEYKLLRITGYNTPAALSKTTSRASGTKKRISQSQPR